MTFKLSNMIKQVQLTGEKKWYGDYFLAIQNEAWKVLEQWLSQYNTACILSGCKVTVNGSDATKYDISAGIVLMKDSAGVYQYAEFAGDTGLTLPGYMILATVPTSGLYNDGNVKNIYITTSAIFQNTAPGAGVDYIRFTSAGATTWKDVVGISTLVAPPETWRNIGDAGQPSLIDSSKIANLTYLRFRKDSLGFVEIEGQLDIKSTNAGSICPLFYLPSDYRPSGIQYKIGVAAQNGNDFGTTTGSGQLHSLWVATSSGEVFIEPTHNIDSHGVTVLFYLQYRL